MNPLHLLILLLLLSSAGYFIGRKKAFAVAGGTQGTQKLHSRPVYYGALTAMWCGIPAIAVVAAWLAFEPSIITGLVLNGLPDEIRSLPDGRLNLLVNDIRNLVDGNIVSAASDPMIQQAADRYSHLKLISLTSLTIASVSLSLLALIFIRSRIVPNLRARNQVERIVRYLLIACSMIAIFTTIGIILSVLYEATRSETLRQVVIPAAFPGIVGSLLLAVSRAIGETMIVVMAAGLSANLTANPFQAVTTVTVQIVTLLVGDQEFDSPKTLAAFALGLLLFLVTLALNVIALVVISDVTQLRRLEDMRRDFAASVSHEIKTPLTAIKGFVETLCTGEGDDREETRRFLTIIDKHVNRLATIIDDLMQLSRIESDLEVQQIGLECCRIEDVLNTAIGLCKGKSKEKGIDVKLACEADFSGKYDATLLEQAAVNLLDNAIKYSPAKSVIRIEALTVDDEIQIRFKDQGMGIAKKHLPRLFERFYRVDKARSRKLGGTGLGLAIVKHIAQAHGGNVTVESELGKGSTFTLRLPVKQQA